MKNIYTVLYFSLLLPFCIGHDEIKCFSSFLKNCCAGYELINNECTPICEGGCPQQKICLQPNICGFAEPEFYFWRRYCGRNRNDDKTTYCGKCYPLYVPIFNNNSFTDCQPDCHQKCTHGFCNSAGICTKSNPDYQVYESFENVTSLTTIEIDEKSASSTEKEINSFCENFCSDGVCIAGLCQKTTLSIKEDPYISTTDVVDEEAISPSAIDVTSNCQNGCWGGICSKGICQCKDGLILNETTNDCIMPCESNCRNGVCNQDNICICNQGYIFQTNSDGCIPQCDRECINSNCVAPTHCECIEGDISKFNISSALECYPTCEGVNGKNSCLNGTCLAVNKCQCFNGFIPKPGDRFKCIRASHRQRILFYFIWIIVILTVATLIVLGLLTYKKMRRVDYNIEEIEKNYSTVAFQNHHEQKCCSV